MTGSCNIMLQYEYFQCVCSVCACAVRTSVALCVVSYCFGQTAVSPDLRLYITEVMDTCRVLYSLMYTHAHTHMHAHVGLHCACAARSNETTARACTGLVSGARDVRVPLLRVL